MSYNMQIFLKKFKEIYSSSQTKISGKWNIAIVDRNQNEIFPFGKEMKKNLILNQGLDILAASKYYTNYSVFNWNTIPSFLIGGAVYGDGENAPNITDTSLTNQKSETSIINDNSCTIIDDLLNGTRTFRKVYDFSTIQIADGKQQLSEAGVYTNWKSDKTLFSKFLLPRSITLDYGQFVRLFYDFTIGSNMIVNPTNINLSSGTFNGSGLFKLCGRFDDIFGSFDSNGNPRIVYGDSPRASFLPFYEKFCTEITTCETEIFGTAYLLSPGIINFNSINQPIFTEWVGSRLEERLDTINPSSYTEGNFYRDTEYIFDYSNPTYNKQVEGILFTVLRGSPVSPRQNTIDGWLWKFNNNQIKQSSKKIVMMLRQSVSRI